MESFLSRPVLFFSICIPPGTHAKCLSCTLSCTVFIEEERVTAHCFSCENKCNKCFYRFVDGLVWLYCSGTLWIFNKHLNISYKQLQCHSQRGWPLTLSLYTVAIRYVWVCERQKETFRNIQKETFVQLVSHRIFFYVLILLKLTCWEILGPHVTLILIEAPWMFFLSLSAPKWSRSKNKISHKMCFLIDLLAKHIVPDMFQISNEPQSHLLCCFFTVEGQCLSIYATRTLVKYSVTYCLENTVNTIKIKNVHLVLSRQRKDCEQLVFWLIFFY